MIRLRRGVPIFVCSCGAMRIGNNTITMDGVTNTIRWDTSGAPLLPGEFGMDITTGRPWAHVYNSIKSLALLEESMVTGLFRSWVIQQNSGLTSLSLIGFGTAPTTTGTASVLNTTTGQFINYTSAATVGSQAGWVSTAFTQTRRIYNPIIEMTIHTGPDITGIRHWFGLFSATPATADDPAISGIGFRYSTAVDGTAFWRTWSNDGIGGGLVTVTSTPIFPSTPYRLAIVNDVTSARFYINDILVATHSADLPGATTNLGHVERITTLVAASRAIGISKVSLTQRAA